MLIIALIGLPLAACQSEEHCVSQATLEIIEEYDNRDEADDAPVPPLCDEN
jgi:hypothetical protein